MLTFTLDHLRLENASTKSEVSFVFRKFTKDAFNSLFWLVFFEKFELMKLESVENGLKEMFNLSYGRFYFKLSKHEKDVYLSKVPIILSHTVVKSFNDTFPASRLNFNYQFAIEV